MKVLSTRDSVAMGDDIDAPHERMFVFPDEMSVEAIVAAIAGSGYLASIAGGKATWVTISGIVLAVVAQQWADPRPVLSRPIEIAELDVREGIVQMRFSYHAQKDPNLVLEALKLKASV